MAPQGYLDFVTEERTRSLRTMTAMLKKKKKTVNRKAAASSRPAAHAKQPPEDQPDEIERILVDSHKEISRAVSAYVQLEKRGTVESDPLDNIQKPLRPFFEHRRSGRASQTYKGRMIYMPPKRLRMVRTWRVAANGDAELAEPGYQRNLSRGKVTAIVKSLLTQSPDPAIIDNGVDAATYVFAPAFVAQVTLKDGSRIMIDIDAQHRRHSHIIADVPMWVYVVDMTLAAARYNFLLHNTHQTRVPRRCVVPRLRTRPLSATSFFVTQYSAGPEQVDRLLSGLLRGLSTSNGLDFVSLTATVDSDVLAKAHLVLEVWTSSKRWRRLEGTEPKLDDKDAEDVFSSKGVLQAVGAMVKERPNMSIVKLRSIVEHLETVNCGKVSKLRSNLGTTQDAVKNLKKVLSEHLKKMSD